MADTVREWLELAGRYPLLDKAQEVHAGQLVRRWLDWPGGPDVAPVKVQRAGRRAKDKLINCNLRLVAAMSKPFFNRGLPQADVLQGGAMGLVRAAEKFDPARGYAFSTYATAWIRQGCRREIQNNARTIRVPTHALEKLATLRRVRCDLAQELGRMPTRAEVAERLAMAPDAVTELLRLTTEATSLDAKLGSKTDDGSELVDLLAAPESDDDHGPAPEKLRVLVEACSAALPADQAAMFQLRAEGHRLGEIGEAAGVSRSRAGQVAGAAVKRLKRHHGLAQLAAEVLAA
jgi:RNA polymerase primary sigma factor